MSWSKSLGRLRPISRLYTAHIIKAVAVMIATATIKPVIRITLSHQRGSTYSLRSSSRYCNEKHSFVDSPLEQ